MDERRARIVKNLTECMADARSLNEGMLEYLVEMALAEALKDESDAVKRRKPRVPIIPRKH